MCKIMLVPWDVIHINAKFVSGSVAIVIAACVLNFQRAIVLLVISLVTVFFLAWDWMMECYGDRVWEELYPIRDLLSRNWFWMKWWEIRPSSNLVSIFFLWGASSLSKEVTSFTGRFIIKPLKKMINQVIYKKSFLVAVTNIYNEQDSLKGSLYPGNDNILRLRNFIVREISTSTEFKQGWIKETQAVDDKVWEELQCTTAHIN